MILSSSTYIGLSLPPVCQKGFYDIQTFANQHVNTSWVNSLKCERDNKPPVLQGGDSYCQMSLLLNQVLYYSGKLL